MSTAEQGSTVKVHYTGTLKNGQQFDSSRERDPLEFTLGEGKLIPGFEEAVTGMEVGDVESITIPAKEAYGERRDDLVVEVSKEELPQNAEPEVGMQLELKNQDGQAIPVQITEIKDEVVVLDANHPLAGKDLNFEIELLEIA
ncbi:MAG: FKBP-type peptidyl-prolyl cis-trans isomerase [Bacteroidota bacterium]